MPRTRPKTEDDAPAPLPLAENLSYRLSMLNFQMVRTTARTYLARGLTAHQWKVLSVLYSFAPMSAAAVTARVTLDKAAVSRAVRQLRELGLVKRDLHSDDARSVDISLTAKGRTLYAAMASEIRQLQDALFAALSAGEAAALFPIIDKLEQALKARGAGA